MGFQLASLLSGGKGTIRHGGVSDEVPDVSRFRQKELLGSGGFADVYRQGLMGISCDLLLATCEEAAVNRGKVRPHQTLATCRPALFALCMS